MVCFALDFYFKKFKKIFFTLTINFLKNNQTLRNSLVINITSFKKLTDFPWNIAS